MSMKSLRWIMMAAVLVSLAGLACAQVGDQNVTAPSSGENITANVTPAIAVADQRIAGNATLGTVAVESVTSNGSGWLVIHNNLFGNPGGVIGYTAVENGTTTNVTVTVHTLVAADTLYAILHRDAGQPDVFEYPAVDTEQTANGRIAIVPFNVTAQNFTLLNLTRLARNATPSASRIPTPLPTPAGTLPTGSPTRGDENDDRDDDDDRR